MLMGEEFYVQGMLTHGGQSDFFIQYLGSRSLLYSFRSLLSGFLFYMFNGSEKYSFVEVRVTTSIDDAWSKLIKTLTADRRASGMEYRNY